MPIGVDFGLTVTDAVLVEAGVVLLHRALHRPGPASAAVLERAVAALGTTDHDARVIGVTGGRSRELPATLGPARIHQVDEPSAIGRGGLALAELSRALVVSCGTGTAMIAADAEDGRYRHVSGTPVGGGTLEGLGARMLGVGDAPTLAAMAERGDASKVDTTLGDVLGGGVGDLPPRATAVSFGRFAEGSTDAEPDDVAAALSTMVSQTIGLLALNAARAHGMDDVVIVGRTAELAPIAGMIRAVFAVYGAVSGLHVPDGAAAATAYGAALAATAAKEAHA
ncbi:MAG: hypothetical protein R6W77_01450 [Trueperaceae bacterium]